MSTFFDGEADSEEERAESRKRALQRIQTENVELKDAAHDVVPENDDSSEGELLSEEKELEHLRRNAIYKQYAGSSKRRPFAPSQTAKRQRTEYTETDGAPEHVSEGSLLHDSILPGTSHPDTSPQEQTVHQEDESVAQGTIAERDKHADEKHMGASASAGERRRRPRIDPKIIDDSSEEDSSDDQSDDDDAIGPALPQEFETPLQDTNPLDGLPIQNEVALGSTHSSYVSCLAIDKAGNRVVSGSVDSTIKLWDFNAMSRSLQSFRTINPLGGPMRCVQYSATGGKLLCSGGESTAMITDRDGHVFSQTATGDMYIVDMARTKGHTGPIQDAKWRPVRNSSSNEILTCSVDATIRLWDVTRTQEKPMVRYPVMHQVRVTKLRNSRGAKTIATTLDWLADGKTCVLGCSDGTIKLMDPNGYSMRPLAESVGIVGHGVEMTSVCIAPPTCAAPLLLVRSTDDSLRVLDQRNLSKTLAEFIDLPNVVSETNACFVGDSADYFLTGTSANRKGGSLKGSVRLFDRVKMQEVWKSEMDMETGSVVATMWHSGLNQILCGTGDGRIRVFYDPSVSRGGIMNCLAKSEFRKSHGMASVGVGQIYTPSSLHERNSSRRSRGNTDSDAVLSAEQLSSRGRRELSKAMQPKLYSGPEALRPKTSTTLAKHISGNAVTQEWSQDPRQAILKYAEVAKENPQFTAAYQKTQPQTLLAEKTAEQEEEDSRRAIFERDMLRKRKK